MNNQSKCNKILVQLLVIAFLLVMLPAAALASFSGGDGTAGNPYQIETPEQLHSVREDLDKHFILMNNIDLSVYGSVYGWEPIGTPHEPFIGIFDGNRVQKSEIVTTL